MSGTTDAPSGTLKITIDVARRLDIVRNDGEQTFATLRRRLDEEPSYFRERMLLNLLIDWFDFEREESDSLSESSTF